MNNLRQLICDGYRRLEISDEVGLLLLTVLIGVVGGFGGAFFRLGIEHLLHFSYGSSGESFYSSVASIPWFYRLFLPAIGGLIIGPIISFVCKEARGHGVPEVMEAMNLNHSRIRGRVIPFKVLTSAICIGSGGSAGAEGPIVQVGAGFGSNLGQYLKLNERKLRTLVAAGAAAGIAATFNTPISGALFAIEILLGEYQVTNLAAIINASVISATIARIYLGNTARLMISQDVPYHMESPIELVFYGLLAIVCSFIALFFVNALFRSEKCFLEDIPLPDWLKPGIGGLMVGGLAVFVPRILAVGYPVIKSAMGNNLPLMVIIVLLGTKIIATDLTLGSGGSGGVLSPSLFIGAMTGVLFGRGAEFLFPAFVATPACYALVGMGSVLSASTHAPLTGAIMIFELTYDYKVILPLMMACSISVITARYFQESNIYTIKLLNQGIDLHSGREASILKTQPVKEAMSSKPITVSESENLETIREKFENCDYTHFPVVSGSSKKDEELIGFVEINKVLNILNDPEMNSNLLNASDLCESIQSISENESLLTALKLMSDEQIDMLAVVDSEGKHRLKGVLTRTDIISNFQDDLRKTRGNTRVS